jgi:hypothetical protein
LTKAKQQKEVKQLEMFGIIKHIPSEYNLTLPMNSAQEVKSFTENLDVDIFVDEAGKPRSRRMELVIIF